MDSQLASIYIRNLIRNSISDDIYYEAFTIRSGNVFCLV